MSVLLASSLVADRFEMQPEGTREEWSLPLKKRLVFNGEGTRVGNLAGRNGQVCAYWLARLSDAGAIRAACRRSDEKLRRASRPVRNKRRTGLPARLKQT